MSMYSSSSSSSCQGSAVDVESSETTRAIPHAATRDFTFNKI